MTKVDVISGFLGAGKTTFIKKMVEEAFKGEKIVLIENEFGEIGIDGGFLKDAGIEISELNSGCICCSLVGDFGKNLKEVYDQFHPDRIIIEPSGVGKLSDVTKSILEVSEQEEIQLNALVTVVNAKKALKQMKAFGEFFNNQIEHATTIVLSRTQDMAEQKLEECVHALQEKNTQAAIITTPWDELSAETILSVLEKKQSMMEELLEEAKHHHDHDHEHDHHEHEHDHDHEHHHHDHDHDHEHEHHHDHDHGEDCTCGCHDHDHDHHHHHADDVFTSWGVETAHKFDKETVKKALESLCNEEAYEHILRAKGILNTTDGTWIHFDMVPGEYEIREGEADYTGRLCVIGTSVDEAEMKTLFGF